MELALLVAAMMVWCASPAVSQMMRGPQANPLHIPTTGGQTYRVCGETLRVQGQASRRNYQNQAMMQAQSQRQAQYDAMLRAQQARPYPPRPVYTLDMRPQYPRRVKRQAPPPRGYQPAFVPDMSHLRSPQYPPPQGSPPQGLHPMPHQQSFLPPQHHQQHRGLPTHIQSLLHALDPPDAPDIPDFPLITTPLGARHGVGRMQPGPAVHPQSGPQVNRPTGSPMNHPTPRQFHHPPPPPPPPPPQPNQLYTRQSAPPIQQNLPQRNRMPSIPVIAGLDTVCFCTDVQTCLILEGSMEVSYVSTCSTQPPPHVRQGGRSEVCCCMG